jgi:hypothetical protein
VSAGRLDDFDKLGLDPDAVHAWSLANNLTNFKFKQTILESDDRKDSPYRCGKDRPGLQFPIRQDGRSLEHTNFVAYLHVELKRATACAKHL